MTDAKPDSGVDTPNSEGVADTEAAQTETTSTPAPSGGDSDAISALTSAVASLTEKVEAMTPQPAQPHALSGGGAMEMPSSVQSRPLDLAQVNAMSEDEINERWDEVQAVLSANAPKNTHRGVSIGVKPSAREQ